MSLVVCADCSKEISSSAKACPHCGAPIAYKNARGNPVLIGLIAGAVVGFGSGAAIFAGKTAWVFFALVLAGLFAVVGSLVGLAVNRKR